MKILLVLMFLVALTACEKKREISSVPNVSEEIIIKGVVEHYGEKDVLLIQDGKKYYVPRSIIPKTIRLEPKKEIEFTTTAELMKKVVIEP